MQGPDQTPSSRLSAAEQRPPEPVEGAAHRLPSESGKPICLPDGPGSSDFMAYSSHKTRPSGGRNLSDPMNDNSMLYICRYGAGCTHRREKLHRTHFWHPNVPELDADTVRANFMCYECGEPFSELSALRTHLSQKNAWSNLSLVGCKVVCLMEGSEWEEAVVLEYHKSGKHHLHFYLIGEKKWMHMRKTMFYIIARPIQPLGIEEVGEVKDDGIETKAGSAKKRDGYHGDNLSLDFAFAQSVLFKVYGCRVQETGYKTTGHHCITDADKDYSRESNSSLLYGELLPRGVDMALGPDRMNGAVARVLFDLGMGTGKVLLQTFLQFRNLRYIYGVEISRGRYKLAETAALRMIEVLGRDRFEVDVVHGQRITIREILPESAAFDRYRQHVEMSAELPTPASIRSKKFKWKPRILHMVCGDLIQTEHIQFADIVMIETDFPESIHAPLCQLLGQMKHGARALTYIDLRRIWPASRMASFGVGLGLAKVIGSSSVAPAGSQSRLLLGLGSIPFRQMDFNRSLSDRYPATWSVRRGHHFYVWRKKMPSEASILSADDSVVLRNLASLDLDADAADFKGAEEVFQKDSAEKEESGELASLFEHDIHSQVKPRNVFRWILKAVQAIFGVKSLNQVAPVSELTMEAPEGLS